MNGIKKSRWACDSGPKSKQTLFFPIPFMLLCNNECEEECGGGPRHNPSPAMCQVLRVYGARLQLKRHRLQDLDEVAVALEEVLDVSQPHAMHQAGVVEGIGLRMEEEREAVGLGSHRQVTRALHP
jgi:hypothetical protein